MARTPLSGDPFEAVKLMVRGVVCATESTGVTRACATTLDMRGLVCTIDAASRRLAERVNIGLELVDSGLD